jgi:hypothetical protein
LIDQLTQNLGGAQGQQESRAPQESRAGSGILDVEVFGTWRYVLIEELTQNLGGAQGQQGSHEPREQGASPLATANGTVLVFLEDWSREPDDKGEEWWRSFEEQLEANREFAKRSIE